MWSFSQKTSLTSTLRRLGGELYKPRTVKLTEEDKITQQGKSLAKPEKNKDGLYFRSSNLHIRFVSSLIILQTITQGESCIKLGSYAMKHKNVLENETYKMTATPSKDQGVSCCEPWKKTSQLPGVCAVGEGWVFIS